VQRARRRARLSSGEENIRAGPRAALSSLMETEEQRGFSAAHTPVTGNPAEATYVLRRSAAHGDLAPLRAEGGRLTPAPREVSRRIRQGLLACPTVGSGLCF